MTRVVVIGAGIGGLSAAAVLAKAGLDVTVLEAHIYPGGCAGTFFHQGYRFDAGATLAAGFYPGGPMDMLGQAAGITSWPTRPAEVAMVVHLPDGTQVTRHSGDSRWDDIQAAFGQTGMDFFRWQEKTSDALWKLALRLPPWPPKSLPDITQAAVIAIPWMLREKAAGLAWDAFHPVDHHLKETSENLRIFVDAQLLISAQTTSEFTNALYATAALDLPRRGVVHLQGGMGAIADTLVEAIRRNGGRVLYRQEVNRIRIGSDSRYLIGTRKGASYPADVAIANLTPWNAAELVQENLPAPLRHLPEKPNLAWGAFVLYAGLDGSIIPAGYPLHHQIIRGRPLGNGNSVFASLNPEWDTTRAPAGQRVLTLSTHTSNLQSWWQDYENDREAYEERKKDLTERVLNAAEIALPGIRSAVKLVLPGTPVTFKRFTHRKWGWVGGFPQTGLLNNFSPRLAKNLWLVGDTIFPGQSTAAVALGGLRVAQAALRELGIQKSFSIKPTYAAEGEK